MVQRRALPLGAAILQRAQATTRLAPAIPASARALPADVASAWSQVRAKTVCRVRVSMITHASLIDLAQGGPIWIGTVEPRYRSRAAVDAFSVSMTHRVPRVVIVRLLGPTDFLVCTKATELRVLRIVFPAVTLWMVGSLAFV